MFAIFKSKSKKLSAAESLYEQAVAQAREPVFYESYGVPDTIDGRFDLITLHVFLLMSRLLEEGREGRTLAQKIFDVMFRDMDRSLREIGIGDLSLPKHVKRMMKGFNGRANMYRQAMADAAPGALEEALKRNLYGSLEAPPEDMVQMMAVYIYESADWLGEQKLDALAAGQVSFKDMKSDAKIEDGKK